MSLTNEEYLETIEKIENVAEVIRKLKAEVEGKLDLKFKTILEAYAYCGFDCSKITKHEELAFMLAQVKNSDLEKHKLKESNDEQRYNN